MIEIKNLYYGYSQKKNVLENINLKIKHGELICLMGANGSGKSTLARIINCLLKKNSGVLIIDGLDADIQKNIFDIRQKVGMVFQNPDNQFVTSIVEDEIAFGAENINLSEQEIKKRIDNALEIIEMSEYKNSMIQMLSGGQKQKIAIAGVLVMEPDYIIFDESLSMISDKKSLLKKIIELNKKQKKTVIFITHDIQEALYFDRLILLDNGKIILDNLTKNILSNTEVLSNLSKILSKIGLEKPFTLKMRDKICEYNPELKTKIKKTFFIKDLAQDILACKFKK